MIIQAQRLISFDFDGDDIDFDIQFIKESNINFNELDTIDVVFHMGNVETISQMKMPLDDEELNEITISEITFKSGLTILILDENSNMIALYQKYHKNLESENFLKKSN